jgi:hypothetical protein
LDDDHILEPVDEGIVLTYELPPILMQHYSKEAAYRQKILALSGRPQPQARDVFDIKQLLDLGASQKPLPSDLVKVLPHAVQNALSIGFDEFSGQVVAFLSADFQTYYGSRAAWEKIQLEVVAALERRIP